MRTPTTGLLPLPGASIYYEVRGSGPALLIVPSGNGDAAPFGPLADMLADRHTVITYDRRGFSRSPLEEGVDDDRRVECDVQDARRLIDEIAGGPAHVFGSSSGAIVALALLESFPDRVRALVCHEPPLASILPDSRRWLGFYSDLYDTYRRFGVERARQAFRDAMGMSTPTRPPKETELPPAELAAMLERLRRNQVFWFEHEILPYPAYLPDFAVLRSVSEQLVLAGGDLSRGDFPYRPNLVLAAETGNDIVHFPGGHVGYVTDPREFAGKLREVLAAHDTVAGTARRPTAQGPAGEVR